MSDDRRNTFRCQVPTDQDEATLRTVRRKFQVRLVEKSAGGYGIATKEKIAVKIGDLLALATSDGFCEVRVIHITTAGDDTRVGLERIRELEFIEEGGAKTASTTLVGLLKKRGTVFKVATVFGLCVVFFVWGITLPHMDWAKDLSFFSPGSSSGAEKSGPADGATTKDSERQLAIDYLRLGKTPKLARDLDLSSEQETTISRIVHDTARALDVLYEQRDSQTAEVWSEVGLQLIRSSWERIDKVLTDEQRERWQEIMSEFTQPAAEPEPSS